MTLLRCKHMLIRTGTNTKSIKQEEKKKKKNKMLLYAFSKLSDGVRWI